MQSIWIKQAQPEWAAEFQSFQAFQTLNNTEAVAWCLTEIPDPLFVFPLCGERFAIELIYSMSSHKRLLSPTLTQASRNPP